uniref:ABC transporter domain-containing protein n=1 Tax=Aegilops tauschii subsp. strangulata TaxID=200361 RepID=A0A453SR18_AEGTS
PGRAARGGDGRHRPQRQRQVHAAPRAQPPLGARPRRRHPRRRRHLRHGRPRAPPQGRHALPAPRHVRRGSVGDNVRYGPQLRGKKLSEAEVKSLLSLSDLDPALSSRPASELSVGQAQRVALARTLANDPEVLLLDEPTSALDPISTQNIEEAIVRLKTARGLTTVIVSHSVKQIQRIADLVCLVVDGEVVEVLAPSALSEAKHPMARRFLELSS